MYLKELPVLLSIVALVTFNVLNNLTGSNLSTFTLALKTMFFPVFGTVYCVLVLRFATNGVRRSRKSPQGNYKLNVWSYIWRYAIVINISSLPVIGLIHVFPVLSAPVLVDVLFALSFFVMSIVAFSNSKKEISKSKV